MFNFFWLEGLLAVTLGLLACNQSGRTASHFGLDPWVSGYRLLAWSFGREIEFSRVAIGLWTLLWDHPLFCPKFNPHQLGLKVLMLVFNIVLSFGSSEDITSFTSNVVSRDVCNFFYPRLKSGDMRDDMNCIKSYSCYSILQILHYCNRWWYAFQHFCTFSIILQNVKEVDFGNG